MERHSRRRRRPGAGRRPRWSRGDGPAYRFGPDGLFTVAHWAWLRRAEPEVAAAARHVLLPHDYLSFCLTGTMTTDRSDVSGTGGGARRTSRTPPTSSPLTPSSSTRGYLPEVLAPTAAAGTVTSGAAEHFGLRPGARSPVGPVTMPPALWRSALRRGKRPCRSGRRGRFTPPPPGRAPTAPAPSPRRLWRASPPLNS